MWTKPGLFCSLPIRLTDIRHLGFLFQILDFDSNLFIFLAKKFNGKTLKIRRIRAWFARAKGVSEPTS